MNRTRLHFQWQDPKLDPSLQTGVSLHSHTLHSRESLSFIDHAARHSSLLRLVLRGGKARYQAIHNAELDLRNAWWTPPLAPEGAYELEARQIRECGLRAIVSLTDHDDIEAPMSLQALDASREVPISVEWTVPVEGTFFHFGIHNLPSEHARAYMRRMEAFTAQPSDQELSSLLFDLAAHRNTLIVMNHPLWDESGAGQARHAGLAALLLERYKDVIHAVELNGLRPWPENRAVVRFARAFNVPVISGGDRHVLEPNATLNLTRATTFPEFAGEIRKDKKSDVLLMKQYCEPFALRIFHNMIDVLKTYDDHGLGWRKWSDRVFFQRGDGSISSLTNVWSDKPPLPVAIFVGTMLFAAQPSIRNVLKMATQGNRENVFQEV